MGNNRSQGEDSWRSHMFDTIKGSDFLADQDAVRTLCQAASSAVLEMDNFGTAFSRDEEGRIAQRPFGGAGFPRTCYAADRTGHNLLNTLYEQALAREVAFYDEHFVTSLVMDEGRCIGCTALDMVSGQMVGMLAGATLLATGGFGRIYAHSTNAHINTGEVAAMAFRIGARLKDMEFVQFHPTTLVGTNILITEGARGEGGTLLNNEGERFMERYAPKAMELAPRDIVARSIMTEVEQGRAFPGDFVHLDLRGLGESRILERLPGIRAIALDFAGVDPVKDPIPVQPGQHYSMGGLDVDERCSTTVPGLYAAGECACISVHGANRLGGNSLLEALAFGKIAGRSMVGDLIFPSGDRVGVIKSHLEREMDRLERMVAGRYGESVPELRRELKENMFFHFGIFREQRRMADGYRYLGELRKRSSHLSIEDKGRIFNQSLMAALELEGMFLMAEAVAMGSIYRKESRGSHHRTDFPKRDDQRFLAHSIFEWDGGSVRLSHSPVRLGLVPLQERAY